jgi:glycosyltransferase involved in cell wall biosynthesis
VIIPTYNSVNFVSRAIDSVLAQSLLPDEIILVDNNSTDDTLELLTTYAQKSPDLFKVITETVQGPSAARNAGLRIAQGDWVQFLDSDDTLAVDKLANQLTHCPADAQWIVGGYQEIDLLGNLEDFIPDNDYWLGLATGRGIGCTCSNLFRRSLLLAHDGYREDWLDAEDHELYFRLMTGSGNHLPVTPPWVDRTICCYVHDRSGNKQSRNDLAGHLERRIKLHLQLHSYLRHNEPHYYQVQGDLLKLYLLNNYRYWAAFSPEQATTSAEHFFRSSDNWPSHGAGIMPAWIFYTYRWLGFRRAEWIRRFFR